MIDLIIMLILNILDYIGGLMQRGEQSVPVISRSQQ